MAKIWSERGSVGLVCAVTAKLLRFPRFLARRIITPPGIFADRYTIVDNTRATLYTDDPTLFPGYTPRDSLCAHVSRRAVRVSLVAPVKDEAANAAQWCDCIALQTRPPDEIVVVDAGSQDGTVEILLQFAALSQIPFHIIVEEGCNIARARNLAIARARYPIIAATDFGCTPKSDWLAKLVAPFEANEDTRVAAGLYVPVDYQRRPKWRGFPIHPDLRRIQPQNFLPSNRSIAFARSAWEAVGGYPEWLTLTGEDTWFDRELQRLGGEWAFVPDAQVEWHAPENFGAYCRKVYRWAMGDGESGLHAGYYWRYVLQLSAGLGAALMLSAVAALGAIGSPVPIVLCLAGIVALATAALVVRRSAGVSLPILVPEAILEMVQLAGFLAGARCRREARKRRLAPTRGMFFILSGVPVDDTGGGARCTQLALELLQQGFAVTFVHRFPKYERTMLNLKIGHPNLFTCSLAEFKWERFACEHGQWLDEKPLAAIVEFPLGEFVPLLQRVHVHHGVVVYDLLDAWDTALGGNWYSHAIEHQIIALSDVLVATALPLVERLHAQSGRAVTCLPNAVNHRLFDPRRAYARPTDLPTGAWIALYTGALWGDWIDWDVIGALARSDPRAAVVMIGDYRGQYPHGPPNLHFLGLKAQRELPAYLAHADVAIVPWKMNAITHATSPLKVYEYLAMEKPVVAPAITPLCHMPGVFLARDMREFLTCVNDARTRPFPSTEVARFIASNNWEKRVEQLLALVEQTRRGEPNDPSRSAEPA